MANPRLNLQDLSKRSEELFGRKIEHSAVRNYASGWEAERNALRGGEVDVSSEIDDIRRALYRQIIALSEPGLIVTGEIELAKSALAGVPGLSIKETGTVNHQDVNAYMNLLSKSKYDIKPGASAKTSQQRAIEIAREHVNGSGS